MKRHQARKPSGRFVRNTFENTLGLHPNVHERKADGSWCGGMNPTPVGQERPEKCGHCGETMVETKKEDE